MRRVLRAVVRAASGGVLLLTVGGCSGSWPNPFAFDKPPSRGHIENAAYRQTSDQTVLIVNHFEDPGTGSVPVQGVGKALSESLRLALLEEAEFDVWIESRPSVDGAGDRSAAPAKRRSAAGSHDGPDNGTDDEGDGVEPRYIVTGRVTDFLHTADVSREVARWGLFGRRREAIVAIEFTLTDTDTNRIVAADHVDGTASAGWQPSAEVYANIEIGSYLFWSTPLGRASSKAIDEAARRIIDVVPPQFGEPRIVKLTGHRRASVKGGRMWGLARGQEYFVCVLDDGGVATGVYDSLTLEPIMARVSKVGSMEATVLIRGTPPAEIDLRGAVLRRELPSKNVASAGG